MTKNREIASVFTDIADLLEIKGDNPFRIRAYRRAAAAVEGLPDDIATLSSEALRHIPGIGQDLASKITEYLSTGTLRTKQELLNEIPEGLLGLLSIPGLGPKTAKLVFEKLGAESIDDIERLALTHQLRELPGIKAKTEENILKGIRTLRAGKDRMPIGKALPLAEEMIALLREKSPTARIEAAGSLRRRRETVRDIDILAAADTGGEIMSAFIALPHVREVLLHGATKTSVSLHDGIQVDLRVVGRESYGAALAYFTGSKMHNVRIREMAARIGLKVNEYGIFLENGDVRIGGAGEEDVYRVLGLPFIPPELREDQGEIEAALEGTLPDLITAADIKGDLHMHSTWSDGTNTISQLAAAAQKRGYEYIAITDHSKGLGIANGLTPERVMSQREEVWRVNEAMTGFRVLHGIEVDIRSDGTLDLPDSVLETLDFVVASIHSGFRQPKEQITGRLVAAMQNPYVRVIAHPTGRLIGERDGYDLDLNILFKKAWDTGTALEINAHPARLDLNDIMARRAKSLGIPLVISTDSHAAVQFGLIGYGVATARRGWIESSDVVNTMSLSRMLELVKRPKMVRS